MQMSAPSFAPMQKAQPLRLGFSKFWLPDLDSNQGPAD